jgi:hypothetical protein
MIWLFKVNEVFWGDKPKVDEFYTFDTNNTNFDILQYDISLYFGASNYYILNEDNDTNIFSLRLENINKNPTRIPISNSDEIYQIIRNFYLNKNI